MGKDRIYGLYTSRKLDNHKLSLGAGEEVTYNIIADGADSVSSPYVINFNFQREAIKVTIRATVACSVTEWNGRTLKSPITINPGTNPIEIGCGIFKLVASSATVIETSVK